MLPHHPQLMKARSTQFAPWLGMGYRKPSRDIPGMPMALALQIHTLWERFLRFDLLNPLWPNRDRFVLSNGHASLSALRYVASRRCHIGRAAKDVIAKSTS